MSQAEGGWAAAEGVTPFAPGAVPTDRDAAMVAAAHATLKANWREGRRHTGERYAFTCPAAPLARAPPPPRRRRAAHDHRPDESGLDDSPKYDPVFGRLTHDRAGYFWLMERSRRVGWGSRAIIERHPEHVEDVWVGVAYPLSCAALGCLCGEGSDGRYIARAARTAAALVDRCWDERRGLFFDLAGPRERPVSVSTWSALAPSCLGELIPAALRTRLVEEHLLHPRHGRGLGARGFGWSTLVVDLLGTGREAV